MCVKEVRFNSPMTGMHVASVSQKSSSYKDKDCDKKSKDKSGKKSNSLIGSILGALFGSHDSGASRSDSAPSSSHEMDAPFDEEAYVTTPENPQQSVVPEGSTHGAVPNSAEHVPLGAWRLN